MNKSRLHLNFTFLVSFLIILVACNLEKKSTPQKQMDLKSGPWKAQLMVQDNQKLPFLFEVFEDGSLKIFNAEEEIDIQDVKIVKDSIYVHFPVFEGYIEGKLLDSVTIQGSFIKPSLDRVVSFNATYGIQDRFEIKEKPSVNISGSWQTIFNEENPKESYVAKGIFIQQGNMVTGTFRTTTGDYRYLEGVVNGNKLRMSTFDGAHAFLFTGKIQDSTMQGYFYSGNHWKESFKAVKNEDYDLPKEDSLTFLKPGYDKIDFTFEDIKGNKVSLSDEKFKDKVIVLQIMGTWCPNCLDETKFLLDYKNENKNEDFEIIALAFEYAKTKEKAKERLTVFKDKLGITYPVLLAQYGSSDKVEAQDKLPMLNHILSYPTTIYMDKKGKVRKIYTGFNGPATGSEYESFKKEFDGLIKELLEEKEAS